MKEPTKYSFMVTHPIYGDWRGAAVDSGDALTVAAAHWGVRWTRIAGECVITRGGKAVVLHCRRCNGPVYQDGGICQECQERERQARRERDRVIRPSDRRARYAR